jgi:protein-serine/threonine kinase
MDNSEDNRRANNLNAPPDNRNRLFLNFGNNNERFQGNDRAYPTTPSTFPQPVFQQPGQVPAQAAPNQQYAPSFTPQGYFMNNPYPPQYAQQPGAAQYRNPQQQQAQQGGYAPRQDYGNADPTNGLAHQLSHQNLGGAARNAPYDRQPSPSVPRPRTAGAPAQQGYGNNYLNTPVPSLPAQQTVPAFVQGPDARHPERWGPKAVANQKRCSQMATDFFKDSVQHARDRNVR